MVLSQFICIVKCIRFACKYQFTMVYFSICVAKINNSFIWRHKTIKTGTWGFLGWIRIWLPFFNFKNDGNRWQNLFSKNALICIEIGIPRFLRALITNITYIFWNSKWRCRWQHLFFQKNALICLKIGIRSVSGTLITNQLGSWVFNIVLKCWIKLKSITKINQTVMFRTWVQKQPFQNCLCHSFG